jgi:cyclophilin family peptidyl-prolyl cis-trans isomerase
MRLALVVAAAVLAAGFVLPAAAQPEARIETSLGTIVILLEQDKAPATVANFIRYAKQGHFNNTVIYRIVPGFVIQAGSMKADGTWNQTGKPIPLETATGLSNKRGAVAMARDDKPGSATAEFFIDLADSDALALDAKAGAAPNTTGYAVFGTVTAGMEVVDAIVAVPLGGGKGFFPANYPKTAIIIKKVTIGEAPPPVVAPAAAPTAAPTPATAPDQAPPAP